MLVRNKLVAVCAVAIPLAFGAFLLVVPGGLGGGGTLAGIQLIMMVSLGVYVSVVTALAARRQTLYLKRMRGGAVSDPAIIAGLVLPFVIVNVLQVAAVLAVLGATQTMPEHLWLVAVAVLVAEVMFTAVALATTGVTTSPEHAQYTTLPFLLVTLGVAFWSAFLADERFELLGRILPGGALMELTVLGWDGGDLGDAPLLVALSLAWAVIGVVAGRAMFRWEPRR